VTKALPHVADEYKQRHAATEAVDHNVSSARSGGGAKNKKNKPMGKQEQESKIAHLQAIMGQDQKGAAGSDEQPIPSIEQDLPSTQGQFELAEEESDEESSEEE
jgi:hypothetical protein